jgi:hypothetical protein
VPDRYSICSITSSNSLARQAMVTGLCAYTRRLLLNQTSFLLMWGLYIELPSTPIRVRIVNCVQQTSHQPSASATQTGRRNFITGIMIIPRGEHFMHHKSRPIQKPHSICDRLNLPPRIALAKRCPETHPRRPQTKRATRTRLKRCSVNMRSNRCQQRHICSGCQAQDRIVKPPEETWLRLHV